MTAAVSPLSKAGKAALSKDGKIGYISVTLDEGPSDLTEEEAQTIIDAADPASDAGLDGRRPAATSARRSRSPTPRAAR